MDSEIVSKAYLGVESDPQSGKVGQHFVDIGDGSESSAKSPYSAIVGFDGDYCAAVDDCGNDIGISLPSGQADDQVIKSAQVVVGAGKVFLRKGTFWLAAGIRQNIQGAALQGEGIGRTVLKYKPGAITSSIDSPMIQATCFAASGEPTYPWNAGDIEISHMTLDGNKENQTVTPNTLAEYTFVGIMTQRGPSGVGTYNYHNLELRNFGAGGLYAEEYRDGTPSYPWPVPQFIFRDSFVHHNGLDVDPAVYPLAPGRSGVHLDKIGAGCLISNIMSYDNVGNGFHFVMVNGITATGLVSWGNGVGCTYFGTGAGTNESRFRGGMKLSGASAVMKSAVSDIQISSYGDASYGLKTIASADAMDSMRLTADISHSQKYGAFLENSNDLELNARVRDCADIGVFVKNSQGIRLSGSSINNNSDGVRLSGTSHSDITGFISKLNKKFGLQVVGASEQNKVLGGVYANNSQLTDQGYYEILVGASHNIFENVDTFATMANKSSYAIRELAGADYNYYRNILLNGGLPGRISLSGANSVCEGITA
jgi:hypothetical protein